MGALTRAFELVRASKAQCDLTVVSIYVNPASSARGRSGEISRTLQSDLDALAALGADWYSPPPTTRCTLQAIALGGGRRGVRIAGRAMPAGHFRGVATVCSSCLRSSGPMRLFGGKDYQQALVIRRMVRDLNVPVEIVVCPSFANRMVLP